MKKLIIVGMLVLAAIGIVGAQGTTQNKDIKVSASVGKNVYIVSVADLNLGSLNVVSGGSATGNATIRSNHTSWTVKVYADKGVLTQWDGTSYVTTTGATTIPYTFTFNSASGVTTEKIVGQTLPTSVATAPTATFTARTTGGASGQAFAYSVSVAGAAGGADWDAANYQDTIHMVVTAN